MADPTIFPLCPENNSEGVKISRTERQKKLLGMPFGTAAAKLRKSVMFMLAAKAGMLTCYRCAKPIENIEEFSIEHKEAWERADDPIDVYFNLENIAFSHLICNVRLAVKPHKKHPNLQEYRRVSFARYYAKNCVALNIRRRTKRRTGVRKPYKP